MSPTGARSAAAAHARRSSTPPSTGSRPSGSPAAASRSATASSCRCPASRPWLCLTDPDDIKRVFTADTDVLRLGAALAKTSPHPLLLGPTGLTNVDGPEHMRRRKMQLPPFHGRALANYEDVMRAQDRRGAGALAVRTPDPRRHPHAGDLAGGDHRRRLRRHRPRPRRAAARGDARADARGQLAAVLPADDASRPPARTAGTALPADPPPRWPRSTRSCSKRPPSGATAATSTRTTSSGCSCAPPTSTATRCPTARSATRCARCCSAATRRPPPRSRGSSSASPATPTCWRA